MNRSTDLVHSVVGWTTYFGFTVTARAAGCPPRPGRFWAGDADARSCTALKTRYFLLMLKVRSRECAPCLPQVATLVARVSLSLAQISRCSHPTPPAIPALPLLPHEGAAAPPRVNGAIGSPEALPPAEVAYGAATSAARVTANRALSERGPGNISLDFADTDIREVVAQILGTILKVNYTIDPAVHGTATLHTVRPLNRSNCCRHCSRCWRKTAQLW